jgi:hypothetical protein
MSRETTPVQVIQTARARPSHRPPPRGRIDLPERFHSALTDRLGHGIGRELSSDSNDMPGLNKCFLQAHMSQMGHSRRFDAQPATSGLPQ